MEEDDGIRLVVPTPAPLASVDAGYGMLKPESSGQPRWLADFDAAKLLGRRERSAPAALNSPAGLRDV